ncbi:MAG: class I SAM-dependent methyltransferase [Rhodospirillales bacterium]|nr:class I SAM-dependent methyltransferase [Rhodospirillales bacterium]
MATEGGAPAALLMDRIYRRQRHLYDATRKHYLLGRDRLIAELDPPAGGTVLEIGCGTGRNLVAAAKAYPHASLCGLDISALMLETAASGIGRAGLAERVRLARADAACFDPEVLFARPAFDRVFFSYSLSMIPEWRAAIDAALAAVAPGGRLHLVDFGRQKGLPPPFRALLYAWLRRFHVAPNAAHEQALRAAAAALGAHCACRSLYRGYSWSAIVTLPGPGA